jgi:TatA/E family protein of Tat protein translocase
MADAANPAHVKSVHPSHCRFSFFGSMMKRMSFSETIFLFFLALIIFGPKKLPEIARQVGKYMNEFKRASNEFKAQIEQEISNLEIENKQTILPPSPTPEGVTSRTLNAAPSLVSASLAADTSASDTPASDTPASDTSATLAYSEDEPLFAAGSNPPPATEAVVPPEDVTSSVSRESHV